MANTTELSSWAAIADEFKQFSKLYPLLEGQLPLSIHYHAIGFDHGDRTSRWHVENGSGESARSEFQDMAANAWRKLSGVRHPHAWMRWCDVLLAEAVNDELHETTVSGNIYPERPPKLYLLFDVSDACRISGRVARRLSRDEAVWQWPSEEEATDAPLDSSLPAAPGHLSFIPPLELERSTFRQTRHGWEVTFQGQSRQGLPDRVGLRLIQQLFRNPHQRMHVSMLVGLQVAGHGVPLSDGDFGLDKKAIKALQESLKELSRQRVQAQKDEDLGRLAQLTNEYEEIDKHLRANTGLHGKARRLGSDVADVERVRKRAWAQYTSGVELLGDLPLLVQHLEESVETGHELIYQPKLAIEWNTADSDWAL